MAYNCKVKILQSLPGVYPKYQPEIGKIYDAEYRPVEKRGTSSCSAVCLIDILDKRIALRKGEYEIVGGQTE